MSKAKVVYVVVPIVSIRTLMAMMVSAVGRRPASLGTTGIKAFGLPFGHMTGARNITLARRHEHYTWVFRASPVNADVQFRILPSVCTP